MNAAKKRPHRNNWRPFEEAREFARNLKLKDSGEWHIWAQSDARPIDIPADPAGVYQGEGWTVWGDWLGTRRRRGGHRPFQEARAFARRLGLKKFEEWKTWSKSEDRPNDIPSNPAGVYKDKGWTNWSDWLGTRIRRCGHRPFQEAHAFVRGLGLKSQKEWKLWAASSRPLDIPAYPEAVYKNKGWTVWADWLGTRVRRKQHRPFHEAREFVHSLGFMSQSDWRKWVKSESFPDDIPTSPDTSRMW
jgi:hypothetical protein